MYIRCGECLQFKKLSNSSSDTEPYTEPRTSYQCTTCDNSKWAYSNSLSRKDVVNDKLDMGRACYEPSTGQKTVAIIVSVISAVLYCACIAGCIWCCVAQRRRQQMQRANLYQQGGVVYAPGSQPTNPTYFPPPQMTGVPYHPQAHPAQPYQPYVPPPPLMEIHGNADAHPAPPAGSLPPGFLEANQHAASPQN